jgi:hypothetical protein
MESADLADVTARTQRKLSAHHAQLLLHAVHMHLQFKSHMEFGEVYQKMTA